MKKIIIGIIIVFTIIATLFIADYIINKDSCCSCCKKNEVCPSTVCCRCHGFNIIKRR